MRIVFFANNMPDLCGAFLHDIDLADELVKRGHSVSFVALMIPKEGVNGGTFRGYTFTHWSAAERYLESSDLWLCPHYPCLPKVRVINERSYHRPLIATCHFDGRYNWITTGASQKWSEMMCFINKSMVSNYAPLLPPSVVKTEVIRPIFHRSKIVIDEPFGGDCITLVNANQNKGAYQFMDIARRMPQYKFLGVIAYYGALDARVSVPSNIEWIPFENDIRNILKRTRVMLLPSFYESFGRVAVESMINGIPVIYAKSLTQNKPPAGTTEGVEEWIGDAGIACDRENIDEWVSHIQNLDDPDVYADRSQRVKEHVEGMDIFSEAPKIAALVEDFARTHPARVSRGQGPARSAEPQEPRKEPTGGFVLSGGRLQLRR